MDTRVLLSFVTVLLLAGTVPSGAGDPAAASSEQPAASSCSTYMQCRRECEKAGGTVDECREQCRVTSSGEKKRIDPMCVQKCQLDGYDRETCQERCSYSEPTQPTQPDFPGPSRPRPGN